MKIYLIRHGVTEAMQEGFIENDNRDDQLSDVGIEQSQALRKRLELLKADIHTVYTSTLRRSKETANILFPDSKKMEVSRFDEINKGFETYIRENPDMRKVTVVDWERLFNFGNDQERIRFIYPSGTSIANYMVNVSKAFLKILEEESSGNMAIVAHNGTIKSILACVLGDEGVSYFTFKPEPCKYWEVEFKNGRFDLLKMNV